MHSEAAVLKASAPAHYASRAALETEIQELNLSYLLLAQRLLREDPAIGMFRLGISEQLASIIAGLTMAQVMRLAMSSTLLCDFRITDASTLGSTLSAKKIQNSAVHVSILLAGQPVAQIG